MSKLIKNEDYMNLVVTIYKCANLDKDTLFFLYNYVCDKLISGGYDSAYLDKLKIDLNIDNIESDLSNISIKTLDIKDPSMINQFLSPDKSLYFKTTLFDILHRAYYG